MVAPTSGHGHRPTAGVAPQTAATGPAVRAAPCVPTLRLRRETLLVNGSETLAPQFREEAAAVAELWFQYGDGVFVSSAADQPRSAAAHADPDGDAREGGRRSFLRDIEGERRARYLLECLGVVEIACLDEVETCPGSSAEYLLRVDGNVHGIHGRDDDVATGGGAASASPSSSAAATLPAPELEDLFAPLADPGA